MRKVVLEIMIIYMVFAQARAGIQEVHFLPFNPVEKRTAITYIDADGNWYRSSKGAPEQVIKHTCLDFLIYIYVCVFGMCHSLCFV